MTIDRLTLNLLATVFVYVIAYQLVRVIIRSGWPDRAYRRFLFPRRTLRAHLKGDADQADQQIYRSYLAQLATGSDGQRQVALQYLSQLPATTDLAHALIYALSHEKRPEVRARMSQLLRYTLSDLERQNQPAYLASPERVTAWARAIAIWLTELVLIALNWLWLASLNITAILILGAIGLAVALAAMYLVERNAGSVLRFAVLAVGIGLALVWWISDNAHAGEGSTPWHSLAAYGFDGISLQITYPQWLKAENVDTCSDQITVYATGGQTHPPQPVSIYFPLDHRELKATNENCEEAEAQIDINETSPAGKPASVNIQVPSRQALSEGPVEVIPHILDPSTGRDMPATELGFTIQYEEATWRTIRDISGIGAGSATALLALVIAWYLRRK